MSWQARVGRFYFIQYSEDLVHWSYFPIAGDAIQDEILEYKFSVSGPDRFFIRLKILTSYTGDPNTQDLDGDKVNTGDELRDGTDPFVKSDTDGDGLPDDWEVHFLLHPDDPGDDSVDTDGDGMSNLDEYNNGLLGTDPTDYYNGVNYPSIQAIGWPVFPDPGPTDEPGTLLPQPFVVEVRNGTTPLNHIRVTFYTQGVEEGQLSLTENGAGAATIQRVETGPDGRAQVYFRHSFANPFTPTPRIITAKVGSAVPSGNGARATVEAIAQFNYIYPANTLGRHVSEAIDNRINPIAPGSVENAKLVFSVQDHDTPNYVRNTASWCYDLRQPMTCISPWNFNTAPNVEPGGPKGAGTAITAQHVITSAHYELQPGALIRFITTNNQVILRTIRGRRTHPDYYNPLVFGPQDITIYTLDTPLPASITPCKLLPANYANYLSHLLGGRPPAMILDQQEKALVTELYGLSRASSFSLADNAFVRPALHRQRLAFYETMIDGDSSNPAFLIINNTLALLSVVGGSTLGSPPYLSSGTFVTAQISTVNAMIADADADTINTPGPLINTGLQVQTIDLSGFSTFTPP